MYVALLGISTGILLHLDPTIDGVELCGLIGAVMSPLARHTSGFVGSMGLVMTFASAFALLILSITGVNANSAFELLWGMFLATRVQDIIGLMSNYSPNGSHLVVIGSNRISLANGSGLAQVDSNPIFRSSQWRSRLLP